MNTFVVEFRTQNIIAINSSLPQQEFDFMKDEMADFPLIIFPTIFYRSYVIRAEIQK